MLSSPRHVLLASLVAAVSMVTACPTNNTTDETGGGGSSGTTFGRPDSGFQQFDGGAGGSSGTSGTSGNTSGGTSGTTSGGASGNSSGGSGGASSSSGFVSGCTGAEICGDGLDNDCNGAVDEICECTPGTSQPCYVGDPNHAGRGVCSMGSQPCVEEGEGTVWGTCTGSGLPQPVQCGSGVDYACTGNPNEGCRCVPGETRSCYGGPAGTAGRGLCMAGTQSCTMGANGPDWTPCAGEVTPSPERCDGQDHDCDGVNDTGCGCTIGATQACYSGPAGTANVGLCKAGIQACADNGQGGSSFGPCQGEVTPLPDRCDGIDRDCDGNPATGCSCTVGETRSCYSGAAGTAGVGSCRAGTQTCINAAGNIGWGTCEGEVTPAAMQACDGTDRMCNGNPSQGCTCTQGATEACYTGAAGTQNVGLCRGGTRTCQLIGGTLQWGSCTNEVVPGTESCGNNADENCNGQSDENCAAIMCSADVTVNAGTPANVSASGAGLSNFSWRVVTQPTGAGTSAEWTPNPPNQSNVAFLPYIVGVYTLEATARDAQGRTHTCQVDVTAQAHGLRVELTWNGTGDVDLHLHNADNTPWFDSTRNISDANADDCYYATCIPNGPLWSAASGAGAGANPRLDVDNVDANGPENINIDAPLLNHEYVIGVHNYARASGRTPTIKVYCGLTAGVTPSALYTGPVLSGAEDGQCTGNSFWRVARVNFSTAGACTITPINTNTSSQNACDNR